MRPQSLLATAFGLALLASADGCRLTRRNPSPAEASADSLRDSVPRFVELEVTNHNWSDINIFVVHGGVRTRLGTAATARSTPMRFPLSYAYARPITLLATPIGSTSRYESERFLLQPGQRVYWTLENSLARSSLMIR